MKRLLLAPALASLALCAAAPALAHDTTEPAIARGNTLLTVSGEGSTSRVPDIALFSAGVTSTGKTASAALSANSADMTRVIAALRRAGIAERDIQTNNLSLNPVYDSRPRQPGDALEQVAPPIIGYRVNNIVTVKQRKIEEYGKVIDTLVSAGANQVNGPDFQMDKPDAALDEARTKAMASARKRAELYARAAGLRIVRIIAINDGGSYVPRPQAVYARMESDMAAAPPVQAGEVQANANVSVQFELAP